MPPLPPATSCLKVRFVGTKTGTLKWNCIIHTRYTGTAPTQADLTNYANAVGTVWGTSLAPLHSVDTALTEVDVIDLSAQTSPQANVSVNHPGTRTGAGLSGQVCLVSSWLAPLRYRGGHPRNYWPGGAGGDLLDAGHWTAAALISFQAGFQAFFTAMNGTNVGASPTSLILLSYKSGGVFRPTPLPINITGVEVHPRIDTQRRRLGHEV